MQQSLDADNLILAENNAHEASDEEKLSPLDVGKTYPSRIWDNTESAKYIFELESSTAAKIESYYNSYIAQANEHARQIKQQFDISYVGCYPSVDLAFNMNNARSIDECNTIYRVALILNNIYNQEIIDTVDSIRSEFHPTQKRLDSWWLSLLLGKNAHPIMKWSSERPTIFQPKTN